VWLAPSRKPAGVPDRPPATRATTSLARPVRAADGAAVAVLHAWDARRARAYAVGEPARLRALYTPRALAGHADLVLLRRYRGRGLRVTGMRMQLLSVAVLAHRPGLWRLRVTDRLVGAVAVGRGGRVPLPRDRPTSTQLTMVRGSQRAWRVAAVRPVSRGRR
jgi:hypothetical protein